MINLSLIFWRYLASMSESPALKVLQVSACRIGNPRPDQQRFGSALIAGAVRYWRYSALHSHFMSVTGQKPDDGAEFRGIEAINPEGKDRITKPFQNSQRDR